MVWQKGVLSSLFVLVGAQLAAHPFELQDEYYMLTNAPSYKERFFDKNCTEFLLAKDKSKDKHKDEEKKKTVIHGKRRLKLLFEGKRGKRGDHGRKGEKGDRGDKGDKGDQGVQGNQGNQGVPGPVNFLARNNFFVDFFTTQDPATADGTIAKPFKSVQGAINYIQTNHTPVTLQQFQTGATVLIASGVYPENVSITGDNNRITLIPLGNVILGTGSGQAITYTLTSANTNFGSQLRASLTFGTTSPDRCTTSSIPDLSPSVPTFQLLNGLTAANQSLVPGDVVFNGVDTGGVTAKSTNTSILNLYFYNSLCDSVVTETPIAIPPAAVVIANAATTSFQNLVTVDSFYAASDCVFRGGLTLNQNLTTLSTSDMDRVGFKNCQFYGGTITVPHAQPRLFLDAFTNAWINKTAGAVSLSYTPPSLVVSGGGTFEHGTIADITFN